MFLKWGKDPGAVGKGSVPAWCDILTFGNGERRVREVEPNQLSRQLAEEAAGDRAVEEGAPVAHHVHQGDRLGGAGCAHNLNRTGGKGSETCHIR